MPAGPTAAEAALAAFRQGQLPLAERHCRILLEADPANFAGRHLLGVILLARGLPADALPELELAVRLGSTVAGAHYNLGNALSALGRAEAAVASFERAIALKPDFAEAHCNRGNGLVALGRPQEAIASFDAALAANPRIVEAYNNRGRALLQLERAPEALASFERGLAVEPRHVPAHVNRGVALMRLGRVEQALAAFDRAIALKPDSAEAFDQRGLALQAMRRFEQALACHDRAVTLHPGFAQAHVHRALALRELGRLEEAKAACDLAIGSAPDLAAAYNARGIVQHEARRVLAAVADYDRAIALDATLADAFNNRGNAMHDLDRMEEALADFDRALALRPRFPEAINNRGMALQELKRFDEAQAAYDAAIALRPGYPEAYKRRATLRLVRGDFRAGWADYERSATRQLPGAPAGVPYWSGESLRGKSILLSEPNGLGDTIQFFRYIPALVEAGAEITFLGPRHLHRLLATFPSPVRLLAAVPEGGRFDYQCMLWSLPHLLGTEADSIPGGVPYLFPEQARVERWAPVLERGRFNIGICWQGNPERKIDAGRSFPLATFQPVASLPGVRLVSLQKQFGLDQLQRLPPGMTVRDPGDDFDAGADAFLDSAALMASLDLVICADTAIAHVAGALGRPVWLALRHVPEWRWGLDRYDSPWYPGHRLFRQARVGDWASVAEAMAGELRAHPRLAADGATSA